MIYLNYKKIQLIIIGILLVPFFVDAANMRLESGKSEVRVGEQFSVNIVMFSDELVNAVESRLKFSQDSLVVKEIRDGNSAINFWVEKPRIESPGVILFSGITPGGIKGENKHILSVIFEAKNPGIISLALENIKVLKNDGLGTEAIVTNEDVSIFVKPGDGPVYKEAFTDISPPEEFNLSVQNSPDIFDGKNFLIFYAQDKGSGIERYMVKEYRFKALAFLSGWKVADSPYLLRDQKLKSTILVRAIDNEENIRLSRMDATNKIAWYEYLMYLAVTGALFLGLYLLGKNLRKRFAKYVKI